MSDLNDAIQQFDNALARQQEKAMTDKPPLDTMAGQMLDLSKPLTLSSAEFGEEIQRGLVFGIDPKMIGKVMPDPLPSWYGTGADDFNEAEPETDPRKTALDELVALGQEMGGYDAPTVAVTEEMIAAARAAHGGTSDEWIPRVYRAMAAVAPRNDLADRHAQQKKTICELLDERDALAEDYRNDTAKLKSLALVFRARAEAAEFSMQALRNQEAYWMKAERETYALLKAAEQRLAALEPKPDTSEKPFLKALRSGNKERVGIVER